MSEKLIEWEDLPEWVKELLVRLGLAERPEWEAEQLDKYPDWYKWFRVYRSLSWAIPIGLMPVYIGNIHEQELRIQEILPQRISARTEYYYSALERIKYKPEAAWQAYWHHAWLEYYNFQMREAGLKQAYNLSKMISFLTPGGAFFRGFVFGPWTAWQAAKSAWVMAPDIQAMVEFADQLEAQGNVEAAAQIREKIKKVYLVQYPGAAEQLSSVAEWTIGQQIVWALKDVALGKGWEAALGPAGMLFGLLQVLAEQTAQYASVGYTMGLWGLEYEPPPGGAGLMAETSSGVIAPMPYRPEWHWFDFISRFFYGLGRKKAAEVPPSEAASVVAEWRSYAEAYQQKVKQWQEFKQEYELASQTARRGWALINAAKTTLFTDWDSMSWQFRKVTGATWRGVKDVASELTQKYYELKESYTRVYYETFWSEGLSFIEFLRAQRDQQQQALTYRLPFISEEELKMFKQEQSWLVYYNLSMQKWEEQLEVWKKYVSNQPLMPFLPYEAIEYLASAALSGEQLPEDLLAWLKSIGVEEISSPYFWRGNWSIETWEQITLTSTKWYVNQQLWQAAWEGKISYEQYNKLFKNMYYGDESPLAALAEAGLVDERLLKLTAHGFVYKPDIRYPGYRFYLKTRDLIDLLMWAEYHGVEDLSVLSEYAYMIYKGKAKIKKTPGGYIYIEPEQVGGIHVEPLFIEEPGSKPGTYYKPAGEEYTGGYAEYYHQFGGELTIMTPTTIIVGEKGPETVKLRINPRVEGEKAVFNPYELSREVLKCLAERLKPFLKGD
ncbi:hypothetical protein KEJ20_03010 [Candidatus Bathyarchaeota archaeon]|nr:hypothetical protein [Candidatus Bathyarchaeota archaeon]